MQNFFHNILKKKSLKKSNILEARQTISLSNHVVISSHIIFFFFANFQTLPDNSEKPNQSIQSRKISFNWENFFVWLSQKERFLEPMEKNPYIFNYCGVGVSNYVSIAPFCDHEGLYFASSLFYFSFAIDNAKAICLDCLNSNIYSCMFSLLKLHGTFWFMN